MKKLLSILGAAGLVVSTSAVLVSCGTKEEKTPDSSTKVAVDKAIEAIKAATATKPADKDAVAKAVAAELEKINADVEGAAAKTLTADSIKILATTKDGDGKGATNEVIYTVSALTTTLKQEKPTYNEGTPATEEYIFVADDKAVDATDVTIDFGTEGTDPEDVTLDALITTKEVKTAKAGEEVTVEELTTAINAVNKEAKDKYTLVIVSQPIDGGGYAATPGKATATGKDDVTGTVEITFTVKAE